MRQHANRARFLEIRRRFGRRGLVQALHRGTGASGDADRCSRDGGTPRRRNRTERRSEAEEIGDAKFG